MGAEDSDDEGSSEGPKQHQFKVILLGDGAVGKTSIAMRFSQDHFAQSYKQTIGVDFFIKRIALPDGSQVALQIWDIGGQSIGGKMIGNYIYGAHAVLLCYDITNYQSFQDLEDWFRLVRRTFGDGPMPTVALVGNKTDLSHMRTVRTSLHAQFCEENETQSFFLSAKNGENVNACFFRLAASLTGVVMTTPELDSTSTVITAEIVNHKQDGPPPEAAVPAALPAKKATKSCSVQ
jgi:Ras-related protein Rab-28